MICIIRPAKLVSSVLALLVSVSAMLVLAPANALAVPAQPNIIFIMADDMGYGDLGCYGQQYIQTPKIDQLATEGMRFTQCYAGGNVCAPTRCSLMTGLTVGHCTVRNNKAPGGGRVPLLPEDVTVAEVLKDAGYATGIIGKWGLGEPATTGIPNLQGFDFFFGYLNQTNAHSYFPPYLWRNQTQEFYPNNETLRYEYSHDLFTVEAKQFIIDHQAEPFFLYLAYTIPHTTLEVPDNDVSPYTNEPWTWDEKLYAAMTTIMDTDIGEIMALLQQLGLDNDTIVFFCSDNGGTNLGFRFQTNGPLRGAKNSMYDGGIRVPMIARWPGNIPAGVISDYVWAFWDFMPTAADIGGAESFLPNNLDGTSVLPELLGQPQVDHPYLYWEQTSTGIEQAVRIDDWKGVRPSSSAPVELYNLANDLDESDNLAPSYPEIVDRIEHVMATARTYSATYPAQVTWEPCVVYGMEGSVTLLDYSGDSPGCASLSRVVIDTERIYSDRFCTLKTVPANYLDEVLIQHGNDDRNFTGNDFIEFSVIINATVVVAYDSRATVVPSWLNGWTATGEVITATGFPGDVNFNVYTKDFPPISTVVLPGNSAGGGDGPASYIAMVKSGTLVPGDFDYDDDVDQEDYGRFQACLTGAGIIQDDPACFLAKLDNDQDVDLDDRILFVGCMSGPNIPGSLTCAD